MLYSKPITPEIRAMMAVAELSEWHAARRCELSQRIDRAGQRLADFRAWLQLPGFARLGNREAYAQQISFWAGACESSNTWPVFKVQ